jgi:hypothetical protein
MAEEWGLMGGLLIIAGFSMLIWWGMKVALEAKERFERLAAAGLTATIFFYVAINLMMVMGLAPVVREPRITALRSVFDDRIQPVMVRGHGTDEHPRVDVELEMTVVVEPLIFDDRFEASED